MKILAKDLREGYFLHVFGGEFEVLRIQPHEKNPDYIYVAVPGLRDDKLIMYTRNEHVVVTQSAYCY